MAAFAAAAVAACAPAASQPATGAEAPNQADVQPAASSPATAPASPLASSSPAAGATSRPSPGATQQPQGRDDGAGLAPRTETTTSPSAASAVVDRKAKVIYLTFDDGPAVPYTEQILDVLAENDATATFFVVGSMAEQHPGLIDKVKEAGHSIGNHTWSHTALTTLSDSQIRSELQRTAKAVGEANMGGCMRPPYGDRDDRVIGLAKDEGYRTVVWTHWAMDWEQPPVGEILGYLKDASRNKANILLHDGGGERPNTVAALRIMLPKWQEKGFTFRAVPACTKPLA